MSANNHQEEIKKPEIKPAEPEIQEIQEFVVSSEQTRSERKKAEQASINALAGWSSKQKGMAVVVLFVVIAAVCVGIGIKVCELDITVVCAVFAIQMAIGFLLNHNPVWLHLCVAAADLIVGFCLNQVVLMVTSMVVYVAVVVTLEVLHRTGMLKKA